jgi:hypothetical protein
MGGRAQEISNHFLTGVTGDIARKIPEQIMMRVVVVCSYRD